MGKPRSAVLLVCCALLQPAAAVQAQQDLWPDLSSASRPAGGGEKDAAVVVGAENYAFVERVPGAKRNALDWQAYLTGARRVPAEHLTLLLNDDATREQLAEAAKKAAGQAGPGGTLWFVFIGHGAPSADGRDGLLVGADAQQKSQSLYSRSLSRNELLATLAKGQQARTVVLLDACFSGKSSSGHSIVEGLQPLVTMRLLPAGVDNRTVLITAAQSDQFAGPLPGGSRPAFSYLALGALRGWAADARGEVTAAGLVDYVRKVLSFSHDRQQTPELSTPQAAGVVLGRGREAGPNLAKLQREAAQASGGGFQVTNLPAVPVAQAPKALDASAMASSDFRNVDVEGLRRYDVVLKLDKSPTATPEEKAGDWRRLAKDVPRFADMAGKRAAAWDAFAAQQQEARALRRKRTEARDADWEKLSQVLAIEVVPAADKRRWSEDFLKAYETSPGVDPRMAKALAPHLPPGAQRESMKALALKAPAIEWIRIPGGTFLMSFNQPDLSRRVTIKSFEMAKTLVTNKQYRACVAAGSCMAAQDYGAKYNGDNQPVVGVDWEQARAFSRWAGGRLPSDAEWEYAARSGGKDLLYPWGDERPTCDKAAIGGCTSAPTSVCSKPKGNTEQGLCDMAGNVREWVQDCWNYDFKGAPNDGSAWEEPGCERVRRSAAFYNEVQFGQTINRDNHPPDRNSNALGFRPAR